MFSASMLDTSRYDRSRRGLTTLLSFALEVVAAGAVLLLPLLYTQGLPHMQLMSALVVPPHRQRQPLRETLVQQIETSHPRAR